MIHYIIQILAFQLLFLVVYDLFLKKETFFNGNRVYLLITPILSFILPLIKIKVLQESIPQEYIIQLPAVLIGNSTSQGIVLPEVVLNSSNSFSQFLIAPNTFEYVWYIGMMISLLLFSYKIYKIIKLKQSGTKTKLDRFNLVSIPNTNTAFSFFNTIFIGTALSEVKKTNILLHEKIHVSQYHSLDLIFFEVLRILFWFNPLVYVYQHRMATLQEYIADAKAIAETGKKEYYQDLLSQIFQTEKISFINTFFNHSLIKNRIIMLQKSKSKKMLKLKYLLLVPVICSMLLYTSCTQDSFAQAGSESENTTNSKSEILRNIEELKESIAAKGDMTSEEEQALKGLLLLTTKDGFKEPFFADVIDKAEIPFGVIEKVPVYPGCEGLSQEETKKCFGQKISEFVSNEFNVEIAKKNNLTGRQKIGVRFKIDNTGKVTDIKVKTKDPELKAEALRLANKLPKMTPGVQDGINVGVVYTLPIVFEVKE